MPEAYPVPQSPQSAIGGWVLLDPDDAAMINDVLARTWASMQSASAVAPSPDEIAAAQHRLGSAIESTG